MIKKIISVILCLISALILLTGCSKNETAVNISGAMVTKGIYSYYLDYAAGNADNLKLDMNDYESSAKKKALELIKSYVAINSIFEKLNLSLSYSLKAQSASDTDSYWETFGVHYSKVGITKQDIAKIMENNCRKTALLNYYYGQDSKVNPTSKATLKKAFEKKYFGVKLIAAPLTTTDTMGNTISLDDDSLTEVRAKFSSLKTKLNYGKSFEDVYSEYNMGEDIIGTQNPETYILASSTKEYGKEFTQTASNLSYNEADTVEYEDTIYLIYRVNISSDNK